MFHVKHGGLRRVEGVMFRPSCSAATRTAHPTAKRASRCTPGASIPGHRADAGACLPRAHAAPPWWVAVAPGVMIFDGARWCCVRRMPCPPNACPRSALSAEPYPAASGSAPSGAAMSTVTDARALRPGSRPRRGHATTPGTRRRSARVTTCLPRPSRGRLPSGGAASAIRFRRRTHPGRACSRIPRDRALASGRGAVSGHDVSRCRDAGPSRGCSVAKSYPEVEILRKHPMDTICTN